MKILWIDDEIHNSAALVEIAQALGARGHSVERFDRPDPALDVLRSEEFDVILVDLQLNPGDQDGIEVAMEIRAWAAKPPLVALTAFQQRFTPRIPQGGFAAVLDKSDYLGRDDGASALARKLDAIIRDYRTQSHGGVSRVAANRWFLRATARIMRAWRHAVSELFTEMWGFGVKARAWDKARLLHVRAFGLPGAAPMAACAPVLSV